MLKSWSHKPVSQAVWDNVGTHPAPHDGRLFCRLRHSARPAYPNQCKAGHIARLFKVQTLRHAISIAENWLPATAQTATAIPFLPIFLCRRFSSCRLLHAFLLARLAGRSCPRPGRVENWRARIRLRSSPRFQLPPMTSRILSRCALTFAFDGFINSLL